MIRKLRRETFIYEKKRDGTMRRIAGNFKTTDQSVEVSDKAYSFLLITYERKNGQEWTSEQKENADHGPILRESKTINKRR